jgi:membrane protein
VQKRVPHSQSSWLGATVIFGFARYLVRSITSGHSLQVASALAYTTLLSLVPLIAVTAGFLGALPGFSQFEDMIRDFVFENFVPAYGATIDAYLGQFAERASQLTLGGIGFLVVIALMLMATIENAFNDIWRVSEKRGPLLRFLIYWLVLTLGPILVGAGLASTSYLLAVSGTEELIELERRLLSVLPFLMTTIALVLLYILVPNCHVPVRHAVIGGISAAILFESAKYGFAYYISTVPTYGAIYGALAVLPIFLVWIYISWVIVLLGAQLTYSLNTFRPAAPLPDRDWDLVDVCLLLHHLWHVQRDGAGLTLDQLRVLEPELEPEHIIAILNELQTANWIVQRDTGEWMLVRDLSEQTLLDLHRLLPRKLPDEHVARIPGSAAERKLQIAFDSYRGSLQQTLAVPIKALLQDTVCNPPTTTDSD